MDLTYKKIISWTAVVLWMALIFLLSAQVGDDSGSLSGGITAFVFKAINGVFPGIDLDMETMHHIIRKFAHFFAYFMLGMFILNALTCDKNCERRDFLVALIICVLYAASDEIHQSFVPGRGPAIKDVLIDSSGAFTGLMVLIFIKKYVLKQK